MAPARATSSRQIALLRGVNLGSRNRISMPALRDLLRDAGYGDVETLLQSGNVVLTSKAQPKRTGRHIREVLRDGAGVDVEVVVRARDELAAVVRRNPLRQSATDPKRYNVLFLAREPARSALEGLDAARYEPERLAAHGRELYVWWPDGLHRAKLTPALLERRLGVVATARNWNTVEKLLALADG
jgi:uncharacterized protein (DUF1697 family)